MLKPKNRSRGTHADRRDVYLSPATLLPKVRGAVCRRDVRDSALGRLTGRVVLDRQARRLPVLLAARVDTDVAITEQRQTARSRI
jgi:hypothetical protein